MTEAPVHVQIFGTEYKIAANADTDHTRNVARYVDQKMREIANSLSLRSVAKISVLTAVNLADELSREEAAESVLQEAVTCGVSRLGHTTADLS